MSWRFSSTYTPRDLSSTRENKYGVSSIASKFGSHDSSERQSRWSKANSTIDSPRSYRTSSTIDHSPIWAKNNISDSSSSLVQRLKERYNSNDSPKSDKLGELRTTKRTETKDLSASLPSRTYGRQESKDSSKDYSYGSYSRTESTESRKDTSKDYGYGSYNRTDSTDSRKDTKDYGYGSYKRTESTESKKEPAKDYGYSTKTTTSNENDVYSRFRKRPEKSPESEKSTYEYRTRRPDYTTTSAYSPLESRNKLYTSSSLGSSPATSRYLGSKKYNDQSPTSVNNTFSYNSTGTSDRYSRNEKPAEVEEETLTVVTRGTSPTEPSASVYVRTRRADLSKGIEKKVPKLKTKPEMVDKEVQTEKHEEPTSPTSPTNRYNSLDTNTRAKPWSSYLDKYSSGSTSSYGSTSRYSRYGGESRREPSISVSYPSRYETTRSISREEPVEEPVKTQEVTVVSKPPRAASPVKEIVKKTETESVKSVAVVNLTSKSPEVKKNTTAGAGKLMKSPTRKSSESEDSAPAARKLIKSPTKKSMEKEETKNTSKPLSPSTKSVKSPSRKSSEMDTSPSLSKSSSRKSAESDSLSSYDNLKPTPPKKSPSPLQFKLSPEPESKAKPEVKSPTPKSTSQSISKDSSSSESSSEEETSSEEESEDEKEAPTTTSATSSVKRSITNFLQNIPSYLSRKPTSSTESVNRSKPNLYQKLAIQSGSTAKLKVNKIESGERAWWLESSNEKIPDGITKVLSKSSVNKSEEEDRRYKIPKQYSNDEWWLKDDDDNNQLTKSNNQSKTNLKLPPKVPSSSHTNLLAPPNVINRQYSPDKDWLKSSADDICEKAQQQIDNSASILKQCNGDNTWWLDNNENITNEAPPMTGFKIRKIWSEEKPWWVTDTPSTTTGADGGNINRIVANGNYDGSISVENGISDSNNLDVINSGKDTNSINEAECDQVCGKWLSDGVTIAQNEYSGLENNIKNGINESGTQERNNNVNEEDGEESFDVTPALRRRREQRGSKSPDNYHPEDINYQMKFNQNLEATTEPANDGKKYLEDFQLECSVKDLTQKLVNQNGLSSPLEEKNNNLLEAGDMSGMISKAKAGLMKSKTKQDIRKSSSDEMSQKVAEIQKSEIDLYWKELVDSINRPLRLCDLDFTDLNTDDETDVFGNSKVNGDVPPPPPLLIMPMPINMNVPTPPSSMFKISKAPAPPPMNLIVKNKKTVKLFWKEVKDDPIIIQKSSSGAPLIWDELQRVTVDTQKLEHLFESRAKDLITKKQGEQNKSKEVIVLDHKRSNAINIGMTKLPPPRAIKTAILKMDSTVVNKEGIEKLLTMLPTDEERMRIQDAQNANPDLPLGSAEQFLLTLASISELEARLKLWAFKLDFENSEKEICEPLMDLKQGIEILRVNKTFRGILSTLLSIGNFLNGYDVKGFQIDYLSKVPEVKDTVHKHSLLHHLCVIVMEKFPDSTDLYSEIGAVTRASKVDFDELAANIKKIEDECKLSWNYLKIIAKHEGHTTMKMKMSDFLADCAERIIVLGIVHKRIISRFQKFIFWLGIPMNRISTTRPNEIFKIISEFALEYRTTRERVLQQVKKMNHRERSRTRGFTTTQSHENNNDVAVRKMNSKEAKDDAKLRQLLNNETTHSENMHHASTWRRHRKETRNLTDDITTNHNDDEIIETLIKTANQIPNNRATLKERRRSRIERNKY